MWVDDASRWMKEGLCRGADPQIFDGDPLYDDTAKGYCQRCTVRVECLQYALANSTVVTGVWGGLNDDERTAQKRGGQRKSCPGCLGLKHFSDGVSEICLGCGLSWRI